MKELTASRNRITSIDLLRGIVMVIMALDHVRDFFHVDAFQHDPLNPQTTTPILFFTRFITHYCAPVFVFLAGMSAYLLGLKKTKPELSSFLIKRGLWLIAIEIVIVTLALTFNPLYNLIVLQVIWAIGISMVILGLLVRLPWAALLTIGLIIILGHNLLDYPELARHHKVGFAWDLVHAAGPAIYPYATDRFLYIAYSFLPWTGIMITGYCLGKIFGPGFDVLKRRKILLSLGTGLIALFIILRYADGYGDPVPWTMQRNSTATFLSFMNIHKYPPSLLYISITLGPGLILLALFEKIQNKVTAFFTVFGRVPFFYYVIHFFLIHTMEVIVFFLEGYGKNDIIDKKTPFLFRPLTFGFNLWGVYLIWMLVIIIMYPLCKKYNKYKSTHSQWWLSYL